jgi:type II secretory pathway pseudopilin PulG
MKRLRGFTIVELAIALSVTVFLSAVAISRFNIYQRDEEFRAGGAEIASCLQRAVLAARSGITVPTAFDGDQPARYVRATIVSSSDGVQCHYEGYPAKVTAANQSTVSIAVNGLLQASPPEIYGNKAQFFAPSTRLAGGVGRVRVVFGSIERGVPLGMSSEQNNIISILRQPPADGSPGGAGVPYGAGFMINESVNSVIIQRDDTLDCGALFMPTIGAPVTFREVTCP